MRSEPSSDSKPSGKVGEFQTWYPPKISMSPKKGPFLSREIVFQSAFLRGIVSFWGSSLIMPNQLSCRALQDVVYMSQETKRFPQVVPLTILASRSHPGHYHHGKHWQTPVRWDVSASQLPLESHRFSLPKKISSKQQKTKCQWMESKNYWTRWLWVCFFKNIFVASILFFPSWDNNVC